MAFSTDVLKAALKKVSDRSKAAQRAFEKQQEAAYAANPELSKIDTDIQIKASAMAMAVFAGRTAEGERLHQEIAELKLVKDRILSDLNLPDSPEVFCPICKDSGYTDGHICQCVKDIASEMCYATLISQMPLDESKFENFDLRYYREEKDENGISPRNQMSAVLNTCRGFAESFPEGKNLLLTGSSGLGKTHLSLAIANVVLKKGYHVIYGSAQNLINEVSRETFDRSGSTEKIDALNTCDLLIIDDLGTEFATQLSVSTVYNIINTRMMRGLSTVISTNLNIKQISEAYNERVASRIIGSYTVCPCFGNDIRLIKASNK